MSETPNIDLVVGVLKDINSTLAKNEAANETVLKENEKKRDEILNRQLEIHARQLKIIFIAATFFIIFLFITGVYVKILVQEIRGAQSSKIAEAKKQERVKSTLDIFKEVWLWYYSAEESDSVFKRFIYNDTTLYANDWIVRHTQLDSLISSNENVNKYYNYFEILKSMDKADLIDHQTAINILPFFVQCGSSFNYIEQLRRSYHIRKCGAENLGPNRNCNCGEVLDGYEYVFSKIMRIEVPKTNTCCLGDKD